MHGSAKEFQFTSFSLYGTNFTRNQHVEGQKITKKYCGTFTAKNKSPKVALHLQYDYFHCCKLLKLTMSMVSYNVYIVPNMKYTIRDYQITFGTTIWLNEFQK